MADGAAPVLDVRGLKTVFRTRGGEIHAVNDVSFTLVRASCWALLAKAGRASR
jgi:oligopeptide transport system ATP-binding protein